nr:hypothetical protein [Tanacetum cinerariifolium]
MQSSDTKEAHDNGHVLDDILLSGPKDRQISYEEFQTTMKAGTEWRKASLGNFLFPCSFDTKEAHDNGHVLDDILLSGPE